MARTKSRSRGRGVNLPEGVEGQILYGLIRGPWSDYWAREQEERGRSFSGEDIYYVAPERMPLDAYRWGFEVADQITKLNGCSLKKLWELAVVRGYPNSAEHFGVDLGLQSVGHGVGYLDDMPASTRSFIRLPRREFYL